MNLTQTSVLARRTINILLAVIILYSVGYFSAPFVKELYNSIFPPKQSAEMIYGKLPKIVFNGLSISSSTSPEYVLNTKDGKLPNITPTVFNVYKVIKPKFNFGPGEAAQKKAEGLKFTENQLASTLSGSIYKWVDNTLSRQLEINITANTLDYSVNVTNNKDKYDVGSIRLSTSGADEAKGLLKDLGYFKDPLYNKGTQKIVFGKIIGDRVPETVAPQEYTLAKIDFFRTIYKVPIFGERYDNGNLEVIFTSPNKDAELLKYSGITAHEWSIDTDKFGKYPPISVSDAWKEVTLGNGIYSKAKLKNASAFEPYEQVRISKVSIENVFFAYYDSRDFQEYMQPIYVFEGNFVSSENQTGRIAIYYPALDPKVFKE